MTNDRKRYIISITQSTIKQLMLKNAHEMRFERYRQLRQEFEQENARLGVKFPGSRVLFSEKVGLHPKYLGHVENGRRQIGDALARKMELAFRKPANWMDTPDPTAIPKKKPDLEVIIAELAEQAAAVDAVATHRALLAIVQGAA